MSKVKPQVISPFFKWTLITAVSFILLSLGMSVAISFCSNPSPMQTTLFQNCMDAWKIGIAAIVGLIGGKVELNAK